MDKEIQTDSASDNQDIDYRAYTTSPFINGEVNLSIGEEHLVIATLFDVVEIPFSDIESLALEDFTVSIKTPDGDFVFSHMGSWRTPFYQALYDCYLSATLQALFVPGQADIEVQGNYAYTEVGESSLGKAYMRVYENCLCILPPDLNARRIPFCFVVGMDKLDHGLSLKLDTGDEYNCSKLGYDQDSFARKIEMNIRALRKRAIALVEGIDPTLSIPQVSAIATLIPEGVAASFDRLASIAPSFAHALEERIAQSSACDSYETFRSICDPARIYVGLKSEQEVLGVNNTKESVGLSEEGETLFLWFMAFSTNGSTCAVEFVSENNEAFATFIFRFESDRDHFAKQLNRALEAISFKREIIRLTEEDLLQSEYSDYLMAVKRNPSLRFVRHCFAGRVIHRTPESWKEAILGHFA